MLFCLFNPDKLDCLFFQDCKDRNIFLNLKTKGGKFF